MNGIFKDYERNMNRILTNIYVNNMKGTLNEYDHVLIILKEYERGMKGVSKDYEQQYDINV